MIGMQASTAGYLKKILQGFFFLLPLAYLPGFSSYSSVRYYFLGFVALVLLPLITSVWLQLPAIPKTLFKKWYGYGAVIFVSIFILTSLFGVDPATSFFSTFQRSDGAFALLFIFILYCAVATYILFRKKDGVHALLSASVWGAVILSICTIFSPEGIGNWFSLARGGAMFGNSSLAASYIVWNIAFGLYLFFSAKNRQKKILWGIATGVLLISPLFINWKLLIGSDVYTGLQSIVGSARGAVLGIVSGGIFAAAVFLSIKRNKIIKNVGIGAVVLVSLLFLLGLVGIFKHNSVIGKQFAAVAGENRFMFWDIAFDGFKARPIMGWGPGNYDVVFHQFYNPGLLSVEGNEQWVDRTHNLFIETLISGGVILLLAFLLLLSSLGYLLYKNHKKGILTNTELALFSGVIVAWLVQAQFIFETTGTISMLFLLLAIAVALSTEVTSVQKQYKYQWLVWIFAGVAAILFVISVTLPMSKDRMLYKTYTASFSSRGERWKQLVPKSFIGNTYDATVVLDRVYRSYLRERKTFQENSKIQSVALTELDALVNYADGINMRKPERFDIAFFAARLAYLRMTIANQGSKAEFDRALAFAEKGIVLAPRDPQIYWVAAQIETLRGDFVKAKQYLADAQKLSPTTERTYRFMLEVAAIAKDTKYRQEVIAMAKMEIPTFEP